MKHISQSQINLYRSCPWAYALRYQYKKEGIWWDPSIVEVGKRVHDAIDVYYKNHFATEFIEEKIRDIVYSILREQWDTTLPVDFLKKAYTCICHFAEWEVNNGYRGRTKPWTEGRIYVNGLMGIIDYLDLNTKTIVDFKTNTRAGIGYGNRMQAVMYKKLVKEKFGIDIPYFTFQFLFPNETRVVKFDKKTMQVQEDIEMYIKQIQESWKTNNFPKQPRTPKGCKSCMFNYYCGGV